MSNRVRCSSRWASTSLFASRSVSSCSAEIDADLIDGREQRLARRHVVRLRIDRHARRALRDLAGQRIEVADLLDLVVEELDAHGVALRLGREDVDDVAAHAIRAAARDRADCARTAAPRAGAASRAGRSACRARGAAPCRGRPRGRRGRRSPTPSRRSRRRGARAAPSSPTSRICSMWLLIDASFSM